VQILNIKRTFTFALLLLTFILQSKIFGQEFDDQELKPENSILVGSTMLLTGSVGYFSGIVIGALLTSTVCYNCSRFGSTYNSILNANLVIGATVLTTTLISTTAVLFHKESNFWFTALGSFLGSIVLPSLFYSRTGQVKDRFTYSIELAWPSTVIGGIIAYFIADKFFQSETTISLMVTDSGQMRVSVGDRFW